MQERIFRCFFSLDIPSDYLKPMVAMTQIRIIDLHPFNFSTSFLSVYAGLAGKFNCVKVQLFANQRAPETLCGLIPVLEISIENWTINVLQTKATIFIKTIELLL